MSEAEVERVLVGGKLDESDVEGVTTPEGAVSVRDDEVVAVLTAGVVFALDSPIADEVVAD